ncbi:MAG: WhiB family transcriptional regulator [Micromonosporaceae bacterium]|nr:WhiB family transcriptional regulator [Micromonosporaceae bacterium]
MTTVRRLPGPVADSWDWQRHGACRGRDSAQFFHPDGERGSSRARREQAAKVVCATCPVRAECAAHALTVQEPYGVWGGFTEAERLRLQDFGWDDLVDRRRGRADVRGLEQRLHEVAPAPAATPRAGPRQLATHPPHQRSAA